MVPVVVAAETTRSSPPAAAAACEEAAGVKVKVDMLMLDKSQLQLLAKLLRNKEVSLMMEQGRVQDLEKANESYAQTLKLLDDSTVLMDAAYSSAGGSQSQAARHVHDYVTFALNACLQNARSDPCSRLNAVRRLRAHYDTLAAALAAASDADVAAEVTEYRTAMWEYCCAQLSASARAHSRAYSAALKLQGVGFDELVRRRQLKLGYGSNGEQFEGLEEAQKLEVYNSIIAESQHVRLLLSGGGAGRRVTWGQAVSFFILLAGSLARDVVAAEHDNVEEAVAGKEGEGVRVMAVKQQVTIGAAISKAMANICAGLFTSCMFAGNPSKVPRMADLKLHTAVVPNGMALAYTIAHG